MDLFCGAGLVHDGLVEAGFEPVGVDIEPQPRYPGAFIQMDVFAMSGPPRGFVAVWASPPCLRETEMRKAPGAKGDGHPDLITPTQAMLDSWGLPFVIENVRNTKLLRNPITLCGSMFDLGVDDAGIWHRLERHRKFETNWELPVPAHLHTHEPVVGCYGGHARRRAKSAGGRGTQDVWERGHQGTIQAAMGVSRYLTCEEMSQGIPPAYACYVATHLLKHLEGR